MNVATASRKSFFLLKKEFFIFFMSMLAFSILSFTLMASLVGFKGWALTMIFLITLYFAIAKTFDTGVVAFIALALCLVTKTLNIEQCLSKFNHHVSWLILMAFFISKGIISSGLARRIALRLASIIGTTPLKLSYALIGAEILLAPLIPSNTARGGGLIYPVAQSFCAELFSKKLEDSRKEKKPENPEAFLLYNCFQANIITSALFMTAMAGNPIIAGLSIEHGYHLTWMNWFTYAALPAFFCLAITPLLQYFLIKNKEVFTFEFQREKITAQYRQLGVMTSSEKLMLLTFISLLISWVFLSNFLHPTAAAFIAVTFLLVTGVLNWDDVISDKSAWTTFLWLTTLLMLSSHLKEFGVIDFFAHSLAKMIPYNIPIIVLMMLVMINFFSHYFFASLTSHATTILPTFIVIGLSFQVPIAPLILSLAFSTSLSAGLTHYGTGSAPIFYNAGYWSLKEWWTLGFIHSFLSLMIFLVVGLPLWWFLA
jgi:DASS family divalent anion:Na+ symporter